MGKNSRYAVEAAIGLTQYCFAISHIVFLVTSWRSTINAIFGIESSIVPYVLAVLVINTLLSWVRGLAKLSVAFMLGVALLIVTVIYVTSYAGWLVA